MNELFVEAGQYALVPRWLCRVWGLPSNQGLLFPGSPIPRVRLASQRLPTLPMDQSQSSPFWISCLCTPSADRIEYIPLRTDYHWDEGKGDRGRKVGLGARGRKRARALACGAPAAPKGARRGADYCSIVAYGHSKHAQRTLGMADPGDNGPSGWRAGNTKLFSVTLPIDGCQFSLRYTKWRK
jgi:hypothetical protein